MAVVSIGALTIPFRLDERHAFELVMDLWQGTAPGLLPTHADSSEPVRRAFDLDDRDDAARSWGQSLWIGRRSNPPMESTVLTGPFLHSTFMIGVESAEDTIRNELTALIASLFSATQSDFGMVHQLTDAEVTEARGEGRPDLLVINRKTGRSTLGVGHTRQLQRGLPTLYWQNHFGTPYVDLFGRQRLLDAPATVREEPLGIVLQVSDEAPTEATWDEFRGRRDGLINYLGRDAFWPVGERIPSAMADFEPPPLAVTT